MELPAIFITLYNIYCLRAWSINILRSDQAANDTDSDIGCGANIVDRTLVTHFIDFFNADEPATNNNPSLTHSSYFENNGKNRWFPLDTTTF